MHQVSRYILSLFEGFDVDARDETREELEESENTGEKFERCLERAHIETMDFEICTIKIRKI